MFKTWAWTQKFTHLENIFFLPQPHCVKLSTNIWNILILVFRLGHAINALVSYFAPLVDNAIGCASNMVNSKQQVLLLDQTKTVAECAQQLLYASKESGGNPKVIFKKKTVFLGQNNPFIKRLQE